MYQLHYKSSEISTIHSEITQPIVSPCSRMNLYLDIFPVISFTFPGSYIMRTIHEIFQKYEILSIVYFNLL